MKEIQLLFTMNPQSSWVTKLQTKLGARRASDIGQLPSVYRLLSNCVSVTKSEIVQTLSSRWRNKATDHQARPADRRTYCQVCCEITTFTARARTKHIITGDYPFSYNLWIPHFGEHAELPMRHKCTLFFAVHLLAWQVLKSRVSNRQGIYT